VVHGEEHASKTASAPVTPQTVFTLCQVAPTIATMSSGADESMLKSPMAVLMLLSIALMGSIALAQAPSEARMQAIRSNCVSDYRANCSSVPTGGMAALVCLQRHENKLSNACWSAVEAVGGGSRATSRNSGSTITILPDGGAFRDAPVLSFGEELRLAADTCFRDFHLFCPDVPVGHGNALFCLKVHGPKLEPACRRALVAAGESL